jgi:hypothetical protein
MLIPSMKTMTLSVWSLAMITGRCECGAVRYRVEGEITDFSHCHCSQCRRLHGAAFASFAGVSRAAFSYDCGESELKCYASSRTHGRVFCGRCGSNILVELGAEPESLYLAMGTLDGAPSLPPGYHIYVDSKAPWHAITDDLPQYATEPDD